MQVSHASQSCKSGLPGGTRTNLQAAVGKPYTERSSIPSKAGYGRSGSAGPSGRTQRRREAAIGQTIDQTIGQTIGDATVAVVAVTGRFQYRRQDSSCESRAARGQGARNIRNYQPDETGWPRARLRARLTTALHACDREISGGTGECVIAFGCYVGSS